MKDKRLNRVFLAFQFIYWPMVILGITESYLAAFVALSVLMSTACLGAAEVKPETEEATSCG